MAMTFRSSRSASWNFAATVPPRLTPRMRAPLGTSNPRRCSTDCSAGIVGSECGSFILIQVQASAVQGLLRSSSLCHLVTRPFREEGKQGGRPDILTSHSFGATFDVRIHPAARVLFPHFFTALRFMPVSRRTLWDGCLGIDWLSRYPRTTCRHALVDSRISATRASRCMARPNRRLPLGDTRAVVAHRRISPTVTFSMSPFQKTFARRSAAFAAINLRKLSPCWWASCRALALCRFASLRHATMVRCQLGAFFRLLW